MSKQTVFVFVFVALVCGLFAFAAALNNGSGLLIFLVLSWMGACGLVLIYPVLHDRISYMKLYGVGSKTPWMSKSVCGCNSLPIITVNKDAEIVAATRSARHMLHLNGSAFPVPFGSVLGGFGQTAEALCNAVIAHPDRQTPTLAKADRAPSEFYVQLSWLPEVDDHEHRSAMVTDANEFKSLERQFVQGHKMQAIGQLAGGIAHDFNNLLTAIGGYCDLLLLNKSKNSAEYDDLTQISENAARAADLVQHLLAFSRRQKFLLSPVDVNEMVSNLLTLLNRLVGEKVTLTFLSGAALPNVNADARQLEQVVMNLIVNARDAMPLGGEIIIETNHLTLSEAQDYDDVVIPPGDYATIEVQDTGIGMTEEVKQKVFDPFYTTKKTGEGTGLGLSTVYGIVKQTGGFVLLDTKPQEGTKFTVYLPTTDKKAEKLKTRSQPDGFHTFGLANVRVLLVEDEAAVRIFASRALTLHGVDVREAESGEAALKIIEDGVFVPDLVVSDVVMPGMNGPEWVEKARDKIESLKVIFVSGYANDQTKLTSRELKEAAFLPKPYSLSSLIEEVQNQANS